MAAKKYSDFRSLIDVFGEPTAEAVRNLASDLAQQEKTVEMWHYRDSIPPEFYLPLSHLLQARGVDISVVDLFELRSARFPKSQKDSHVAA